MTFMVGDRVRWVHNEPNADHDELHGKITVANDPKYMVRFDDGMEEECDRYDLAKE